MFYFRIFLVFICLHIFVSPSYSSFLFKIKFFDAGRTISSYSGLKVLRGEIQDITPYMYSGRDYYVAYYSRSSRRLLSYKYMSNGNVQFEDRLIYDGNKLIKFERYKKKVFLYTTYFYKGSLKTRRVYSLDSSYIMSYFSKDKRLLRTEKYDSSDDLLSYKEFAYDKGGKLTGLSYFRSSGQPINYIKFIYKGGLKFKKEVYNNNKELTRYTVYFYNGRALLSMARSFNSAGKLFGYTTYEYDAFGILRYKEYYDGSGRLLPR